MRPARRRWKLRSPISNRSRDHSILQHRDRRALRGESCDAAYWARGIREPVRFASAVNALADFGVDVWLELNAHPALAHSIAGMPDDARNESARDFFRAP